MRKYYLAILFFLIILISYSQEYTSFVGVRTGPSFPYDNFGNYMSIGTHGFAKTGFNVTTEGAYFFLKNVGIGGLIGFNVHNINKNDLEVQYLRDNYNYSSVIIDVQPYYSTTYMPGFYFNLPIQNTILCFTFKIMAGFFWVRNPEYHFTYVDFKNETYYFSQQSESSTNFTFLYGAGMKINLSDNIGIYFSAEYTGSRSGIHYTTISNYHVSYKRFSFINTTAGVCLFL